MKIINYNEIICVSSILRKVTKIKKNYIDLYIIFHIFSQTDK